MTLTITALERTSRLLAAAGIVWPTPDQWAAYAAQHESHCGEGSTAVGLHLLEGMLYGVPYRVKVRAGGAMKFWELAYSQDYADAYEFLFHRLSRTAVDSGLRKARFSVVSARQERSVISVPLREYDFSAWLRLSSQTHRNWKQADIIWRVLKVTRLSRYIEIARGTYARWAEQDFGQPVDIRALPAIDRMLAAPRAYFLEASISGVDTLIEFRQRVGPDQLDIDWVNSYFVGDGVALNSISCLIAYGMRAAAGLGVQTLNVDLGLSIHFPYKTRLPLARIETGGLDVIVLDGLYGAALS